MSDDVILLAITSDHHTNSTLGLCPPAIGLDDGGQYKGSDVQRKLWRAWQKYIRETERMRDELGAKLICVFNGDVCDGDHHGTTQIITKNRYDMVRIAALVLEPLVSLSEMSIFIRGTTAHAGKSASIEEEIAYDLGGWPNGTGQSSHWGLSLDLMGTIVDFAHHASMGRLPWTKRNAANKIAAVSMFKAVENGVKVPDLVFRSHNHRWSDSYDNYPTRAICLPAWQFKTEYVHRIDPTAVAEIGGVWLVIRKTGYELIKYKVPLAPDKPVRLSYEDIKYVEH